MIEINSDTIKKLGDVRPQQKAKQYDDITKAHQSFNGIKFIEAINGDIVLRGRKGMRDKLYPMSRAYNTFFRMLQFYENLKRNAPMIVTEMREVLLDFGSKIVEAAKYREKNNIPLPPDIDKLKITQLSHLLAGGLNTVLK